MTGEGHGAEKGDFTCKASVFSVKWDVKFSAKSQGEEGYGGLLKDEGGSRSTRET